MRQTLEAVESIAWELNRLGIGAGDLVALRHGGEHSGGAGADFPAAEYGDGGMNFSSGAFLVFLPAVVAVYWLLPHKMRKYWPLAAPYFFYMY